MTRYANASSMGSSLSSEPLMNRAGQESENTSRANSTEAGLTSSSLGTSMSNSHAAAMQTAQSSQKYDQFMSATHTVQNHAFQGWGNFDLSYAPKAGSVTVKVRIGFSFVNGVPEPGSDAADYVWTDEAKEAWKTNFMSSVETVWSGQHGFKCLYNDPSHEQCPTWKDLTPGVAIDMIEDAGNPHFNVEVNKIAPGDFDRSSVSRPRRGPRGTITTTGSANLDSEDMTPTIKGSSPEGVTQRGAVHEFGHMIGLQDEYGTAATAGNPTRQGVDKSQGDSESIMHGGEVVEQAHYRSILDGLNSAVRPFGVTFGLS